MQPAQNKKSVRHGAPAPTPIIANLLTRFLHFSDYPALPGHRIVDISRKATL